MYAIALLILYYFPLLNLINDIIYMFIDFCIIVGINFAIEAKPLELYVPEEQGGIRYHIWRLVTSAPFENFIMLLIVCNTILLMLKVSIFSSFFWNTFDIL